MEHAVKVIEQYHDSSSPADWSAAVEALLALAPPQYLRGLHAVVLSDATGLSHARRRAATKAGKKKVLIKDTYGLYHQAWKGEPAWIELFVENVLRRLPSWAWRFAPFRDIELAFVLFHELGHHVHKTMAPEFRNQEFVADDWASRLALPCFKSRHPTACNLRFVLNPILHFARNQAARRTASVATQ